MERVNGWKMMLGCTLLDLSLTRVPCFKAVTFFRWAASKRNLGCDVPTQPNSPNGQAQLTHIMDNDDNHHRPPVLLQSDDHDHDSRRSSQHLLTALALHANEETSHVHSQTCQDSCPVQDIYTELSYSRFSNGART